MLTMSFYCRAQPKFDSLQSLVKTSSIDTIKVNALLNLSREYSYVSEYSKAFEYGHKALSLARKINFKRGIGTALHLIGNAYNYQGEVNNALEYYLQSIKIKEQIGDKVGLASSFGNIGVLYNDQGNYPKALEYYLKSLKLDKVTGNKKGTAMALSNIGLMYFNMKNNSKALEYHHQSMAIAKEIGNEMGIAGTLNNIGVIYNSQHESEKALNSFKQSLVIEERIGHKSGIANALDCIGVVYNDKGEFSTALEYHLRALDINREIGNKVGMSVSLQNIGEIYLLMGNYRKALEKVGEGLQIAREANARQWISSSYRLLSDIHLKTGQPEKALDYYKQYALIKDSILNDEGNQHIARMNAQYDSEKKDNEIKLLNKEKEKQEAVSAAEGKKQRILTGSVSAGLVLLLLFSLFVLRSNRNKQKANIEITEQTAIIEERNREVHDSITYAKRIQNAILPPAKFIKECLPDSFVLFRPKDIVSGDIYWVDTLKNLVVFAAVDCTGHGVPGAMVSVVGHNSLDRCLKEFSLSQPSLILDRLSQLVEETFETGENEIKDGMDISLCTINKETLQLQYAGANNPLWIIKKNSAVITEIKADKQPIGKFDARKPFSNHEIQLEKGDSVYLFTDGYADQFGGPKGKKFKYKQLQDLLIASQRGTMEEQMKVLNSTFEAWKMDLEQIDDVCIIGVRV